MIKSTKISTHQRPIIGNESLKVCAKTPRQPTREYFIGKNYHNDTFDLSHITTSLKLVVTENTH